MNEIWTVRSKEMWYNNKIAKGKDMHDIIIIFATEQTVSPRHVFKTEATLGHGAAHSLLTQPDRKSVV